MVKLDAMENPYSLPDHLRDDIAHLVASAPINRYPDAGAVSLKVMLRAALAVIGLADVAVSPGPAGLRADFSTAQGRCVSLIHTEPS